MKKTISMLLAVTMIATLVFAFPAPANAAYYNLTLRDPYIEITMATTANPVTSDLVFTPERSGYYIFQTFGFFNEMWGPMDSGVEVTIYDSSNNYVGGYLGGGGYEGGLFFQEYFEGGETYTMYFLFDEDVWRFRLSITNAEHYLASSADEYTDIQSVIIGETVEYPFPDYEEKAFAFLAVFAGDPVPDNYEVVADCCSCTQFRLIIPYGHGFVEYGGSQVVFDAGPGSGGAPLTEDIPYYLVIYRGVGPDICPDHSAYDEITFTIVPSDLL